MTMRSEVGSRSEVGEGVGGRPTDELKGASERAAVQRHGCALCAQARGSRRRRDPIAFPLRPSSIMPSPLPSASDRRALGCLC